MTKEEFQKLGTGIHYKLLAEWNGKRWRLTKTVQATETCFLNGEHARLTKKSIATGYQYVTLVK